MIPSLYRMVDSLIMTKFSSLGAVTTLCHQANMYVFSWCTNQVSCNESHEVLMLRSSLSRTIGWHLVATTCVHVHMGSKVKHKVSNDAKLVTWAALSFQQPLFTVNPIWHEHSKMSWVSNSLTVTYDRTTAARIKIPGTALFSSIYI